MCKHHLMQVSRKRRVPQKVKLLSSFSKNRLPSTLLRCNVISIDCIHATFRSRLMRDLNNIRVTVRARERQRKKVKGHLAFPIDERTKEGFAKERSSRQVKNFHRSIFNETRSSTPQPFPSPRFFFYFHCSRNFRDECAECSRGYDATSTL